MTLRTTPNYPSIITNDHRRQAQSVQDRYAAELKEIDADQDLTDEARRRRKQEAYQQASSEMSKLMHAESAETKERRQAVERRLFGVGQGASSADVISHRDAMDRAGRIEPGGTGAAMQQAIRSGDSALARAILSRALDVHSGEAVAAYLAEFPQHRALVDELESTSNGGPLDKMAYLILTP